MRSGQVQILFLQVGRSLGLVVLPEVEECQNGRGPPSDFCTSDVRETRPEERDDSRERVRRPVIVSQILRQNNIPCVGQEKDAFGESDEGRVVRAVRFRRPRIDAEMMSMCTTSVQQDLEGKPQNIVPSSITTAPSKHSSGLD